MMSAALSRQVILKLSRDSWGQSYLLVQETDPRDVVIDILGGHEPHVPAAECIC